jgi:chromosome segregation ATPase
VNVQAEIRDLKRRVGEVEVIVAVGGVVTQHSKELDRHGDRLFKIDKRTERMELDITEMKGDLAGTRDRIAELTIDMGKRFAAVDADIAAVRSDVSGLDAKVSSLDTKVASLDAKVSSLDAKVSSLDAKVASLDAKVSSLDTKVAALDAKVAILDTKVSSLDSKLDRVLEKIGA